MAVSLKPFADLPDPSVPHELFDLPPLSQVLASPYEADSNRERFLVFAAPVKAAPLNVIVNWPALLKKGAAAR
jgi:hypothetical protein